MPNRSYEELIRHIASRDLSHVLDYLVHDIKSKEGSAINNGGAQSQVDFLISHGVTINEIEEAVERMVSCQEYG